MKIDEETKLKMEQYGNRERYCIDHLFKMRSEKSSKYNYQVIHTDAGKSIGYDAMVAVKDKISGKLLQWYLVEAKVRETMFDDWFLEERKLNTLKKEKQKLFDQSFISTDTSILYITFTLENTLIWFLEDMELGEPEKKQMNAVTVAKNQRKVWKSVYSLKNKDATIVNWSYNGNNHLEELKEMEKVIKKEITGLGNWLFNQETKRKLDEYKNNQ